MSNVESLVKDTTGLCEDHMRTDANNLVATASSTHVPEQHETIHMIQMLREEACSGSIAGLSHIRTQWSFADCLTKKSANPQALIVEGRQGVLKEVDAHPPFRTLVEHKAYWRSWLPTACHHVNFALDVFALQRAFIDRCVQRICCMFLPFHVLCDEGCLVACDVMLKETLIFLNGFVPAAQLFQRSYAFVALLVFLAFSLVVYFLSWTMTTQDIDFLAGAVPLTTVSHFLLPEVSVVVFTFTSVQWMILWRLQGRQLNMLLHWCLETNCLANWVGVETGKQILFVFALVFQQQKKTVFPIAWAKIKTGCVLSTILWQSRWASPSPQSWGTVQIMHMRWMDVAHCHWIPFLILWEIMSALVVNMLRAEFLQHSSMKTTNNDFSLTPTCMIYQCLWPGQCTLVAIKVIPLLWYFLLRFLIDWRRLNDFPWVGYFMLRTNSLKILFTEMAWFDVVVMLCTLCMRMMVAHDTSIFCVLYLRRWIRDGHDLSLTSKGVVLVYDVSLEYFRIVGTCPYLSNNIFGATVGHSLPREVQVGAWWQEITPVQKYAEYLSSDEISNYIDPATEGLIEGRFPNNVIFRRRETAWEFMGQSPPEKYVKCIEGLFEGRRAEALSSSASAEVLDVEAEISAMNNAEVQAVRIISETRWHLWHNQEFLHWETLMDRRFVYNTTRRWS